MSREGIKIALVEVEKYAQVVRLATILRRQVHDVHTEFYQWYVCVPDTFPMAMERCQRLALAGLPMPWEVGDGPNVR